MPVVRSLFLAYPLDVGWVFRGAESEGDVSVVEVTDELLLLLLLLLVVVVVVVDGDEGKGEEGA